MSVQRLIEWSSLGVAAGGLGTILAFFFSAPATPPSWQSLVAVSRSQLDFDTVTAFVPGVQSFEVRNISGQSIEYQVLGDCDCMSFDPPGGELPAGETASVEVGFLPNSVVVDSGSFGSARKDFQVLLRSGTTITPVPMRLSATVLKPFTVSPALLNPRCVALAEQAYELQLSLQSDIEQIEVVRAPAFLRNFKLAKLNSQFKVASFSGQLFASGTENLLEGELILRCHFSTGEPSQEVALSLKASVQPPFEISPALIELYGDEPASVIVTPSKHLENLEVRVESCSLESVTCEPLSSLEITVRHASELVASDDQTEQSGYLTLNIKCTAKSGEASDILSSVPVRVHVGMSTSLIMDPLTVKRSTMVGGGRSNEL